MNKEIINQIYNTIALFGGKDDILSIIIDLSKNKDHETILNRLKNWNIQKTDEIKNRLDRTSKRSLTITNFN
jgi:hypothetical protein